MITQCTIVLKVLKDAKENFWGKIKLNISTEYDQQISC